MSWAAFVLGLVSFLTSLISWLREKELMTLGEQKAIADALARQAEIIRRAIDARKRSDDKFTRLPDDDDGFRRD